MQIPVVVETLGADRFRAEATAPIGVAAEGKSSEEAVHNLREKIEQERTNGRSIVMLELPSADERPWMRFAGHLKDDPLFDEWQAAILEYRQQRDIEDGIQTDERV